MSTQTITWQHVTTGIKLIEALAAADAMGKRRIAVHAHERAVNVAREYSADHPDDPMSALAVLTLLLKDELHKGGSVALYLAAALAIELGLEPDDRAKDYAEATLRAIKRDTAPMYRDNKPFSIFKS
jgi:hypothetical protein